MENIVKGIDKLGGKSTITLMEITSTHKVDKKVIELIATQLFRYFNEYKLEDLKKITSIASKMEGEYKDVLDTINDAFKQT